MMWLYFSVHRFPWMCQHTNSNDINKHMTLNFVLNILLAISIIPLHKIRYFVHNLSSQTVEKRKNEFLDSVNHKIDTNLLVFKYQNVLHSVLCTNNPLKTLVMYSWIIAPGLYHMAIGGKTCITGTFSECSGHSPSCFSLRNVHDEINKLQLLWISAWSLATFPSTQLGFSRNHLHRT